MKNHIRHDWTLEELKELYDQPLLELITLASQIHGRYHDRQEVQVCTIINTKTGGCSEDCKYCAQSSRYNTSIKAEPMMTLERVLDSAKEAIAKGSTRVCLGAAWREVRDGKQFDQILEMVRSITDLGVEVCCTLGMLKEDQLKRLKDAGLYAYNHNLDSSESFYNTIITTRTFQERLQTLDRVESQGISSCCGGILGLGETVMDRLELIRTLSNRDPYPESVPINRLSAIPGTPLGGQAMVSVWELIRIIAVVRLTIPKAMLRLSSGRIDMSHEQQALCFLAGANSIHSGNKLLTVANNSIDKDEEMFELLNLKKRLPFAVKR